eukprot:1140397-Pelagomonas_calceolata.AAC.2
MRHVFFKVVQTLRLIAAGKCRDGGVLTPASAMGLVLMERLKAAGLKFTVHGPAKPLFQESKRGLIHPKKLWKLEKRLKMTVIKVCLTSRDLQAEQLGYLAEALSKEKRRKDYASQQPPSQITHYACAAGAAPHKGLQSYPRKTAPSAYQRHVHLIEISFVRTQGLGNSWRWQSGSMQIFAILSVEAHQVSVQAVSNFLLQHNQKLFYLMSELSDLLLAGMEQPQTDQSNSLAEGLPV